MPERIGYAAGGLVPPAAPRWRYRPRLQDHGVHRLWWTGEQVARDTARWAQLRRRQAERQRLHAEVQKALRGAGDRARVLLEACLGAGQYRSYCEQHFFTVRSSKGRLWEIWDAGQSGNVVLPPADAKQFYRSFCIHPGMQEYRGEPYYMTDADAHLTQALALASDEAAFLHTAYEDGTFEAHPFRGMWRQ